MGDPMRLIWHNEHAEQHRRFGLAVCERLGLDPALIDQRFTWELISDDEKGRVDFTAYLPAEEILAMWNGAAPIVRPAEEPTLNEQSWIDKQGDVWRLGADGLMHTPETAPFPREHVERKWGPLREVPAP